MSGDNKFEKQFPTAPPPPYSVLYPTGNANTQPTPQYGFQTPQQQNVPGHPQQQYHPGYPQQIYQPDYPPQPTPGLMPPPIQTTQPTVGGSTVIVMGGCPTCRVGVLEDDFTLCGILCAICFFPIGILCCLAMREKRCTNCRASF